MQEKNRILNKINSQSFGGSESQLRLLINKLPDESFKDINLILNDTNPKLLEDDKINILWMQHYVNQNEVQNLKKKEYTERLDHIVFNSNWNFEKFYYQFQIPEHKSIVIKNAIEKIEFKEKPKNKISLVYHTTPWRGLALLLDVFKDLSLENVELNICSSTKIYGEKFYNEYEKKYKKIFDDCKNTKNINYYGFVKNEKIIDLLKEMHIYAFPSTWVETSSISTIEAMAAGCEIVTTNLGALYETCAPFGTFVSFDRNMKNLKKKYKKTLIKSIKNFWSTENQNKLELQHKTTNAIYSWDIRSLEWKNFFDETRKLKSI